MCDVEGLAKTPLPAFTIIYPKLFLTLKSLGSFSFSVFRVLVVYTSNFDPKFSWYDFPTK
jgi:hypothetical protein